MSEKPESNEFDEDADDDAVDGEDAQLEHLFKDLDAHKRRGAPKGVEPAWRRLEKYLEQKHTAELLSDVDDYDIDDDETPARRAAAQRAKKPRR